MALFQLLLKEDSESTEVYCVLIVTDYATCVTLFFKVQVLDCVFYAELRRGCAVRKLGRHFCDETSLCGRDKRKKF